MTQKWNFKIKLNDDLTWDRFEKITGYVIPKDLKDFIEKNNASSPEKNCVDINGVERVLNDVLSFNEEEVDATTFKTAYKIMAYKYIIPFARDPFGNYFCYSIETHKIMFYLHEENVLQKTNYSLQKFIDNLY